MTAKHRALFFFVPLCLCGEFLRLPTSEMPSYFLLPTPYHQPPTPSAGPSPMFSFRPSLVRPDTVFELPQPVTSVRVQDAFDFAKLKAPQMTGDMLVGHSSSGVDIAIEGQIGSHAGNLRLSEEQMFLTLESLRQAVHSTSPEDRYRLFLYFDPATATYRSFRDCATVRFEYDLSRKQLFTYTLVIHASRPAIETSPP